MKRNFTEGSWRDLGENMKNRGSGDMKKVKGLVSVILIAIVLMVFSSGLFYNISEQQQGVVTMFGQVISVQSAGLYFKVPLLQQVTKVDTTTHGLPIGYSGNAADVNTSSSYDVVEAEALMITSDFNFVDVDFYLEYRVSDPVKYLYASSNPEDVLKNMAHACIRSTVANYTVDDVITTGKSQIQGEVKEKLVESLQKTDIGLTVVNITIQDAEPPTSAVLQAFKAVETAKQGADTSVNNANKYKNEKVPEAEAKADGITQEAEAAKEARIAEAQGQVERFNQMFEEYSKYPLITKQRLFYEALEDVLPTSKLIIDDGGTQTMLPLGDFTGGSDSYMSNIYNSVNDSTETTNGEEN